MPESSRAETRYRAFISYSHRDEKFAHALHTQLETYRPPRALIGKPSPLGSVPARLAPIFLDREELPSSPDLGERIREALAASLCLIVIASRASAQSRWVDQEVRAFKAMGRADRIFTVIVDGEPNVSNTPDGATMECFCPALRFVVDASGALTTTPAEPLAADAREVGDGKVNAFLKLVSGLLGVGFDQLKQRERIRARRKRLVQAAMGLAAAIIATIGYAGLADDNVAVPGGRSIRTGLDSLGVTLFRPVVAPDVVARDLAQSRSLLRGRLVGLVDAPDWLHGGTPVSVWTFGQVATALARNPEAESADFARAATELASALTVVPPELVAGRAIGWPEQDRTVRTESTLWTLMGLAAIWPKAATLDSAMRDQLAIVLGRAIEAAEASVNPDGGWNDVPRRDNASDHFVYTTALALHALLDMADSGLCWRDDCVRRDQLIEATCAWLVGAFDTRGPERGWRLDRDDDQAPNPNLSILVLSALGRTALRTPGSVTPEIADFAYETLAGLYLRPYQPSGTPVLKFSIFSDADGVTRSTTSAARVLWLPWAYHAAISWSKVAARDQAAASIRRALARSIGYMVSTLAAPMREEELAARTNAYATAETLTSLDRDP